MKLESFSKNKKQKKIIIGSIVGILLMIGSIVLYRTYALYEEKKEFNVLKGKIPDFGYDIKMLSVVVDGEKSKTIPSRGLYKTQIDCSNGTRGEWDYNAWNLTLENVSENARCNITFTSNLTDSEYNQYIEAGVSLRRNTYRGKDITSYLTAEGEMNLYTQISSGRFNDIYVGDYIKSTVDGKEIKWLVADIDNYLYSGYKEGATNHGALTNHHVTIISANSLTSAVMNSENTTKDGYYNSKMKQTTLPQILNTYVKPVFGTHILTYNTLLTNLVDVDSLSMGGANWKGSSNGFSWYESQIDLMSEVNLYGTNVFSSSGYDTGIDNRQYAIFQLKPELINTDGNGIRFGNWLKNVVSSTQFAYVGSGATNVNITGSSGAGYAYMSLGVRPRFLIG